MAAGQPTALTRLATLSAPDPRSAIVVRGITGEHIRLGRSRRASCALPEAKRKLPEAGAYISAEG